MHHLIDLHVNRKKELREITPTGKEYYPDDGKDCIGYGICNGFHGDIEYYYAVQGPKITVYEVNWPVQDDEPQEEHFRLVKTVPLASKKLPPLCKPVAKAA